MYLCLFQISITDIIQQRLLNTTDQVDESRFSPDLAAGLLNDCKTAMSRITTVLILIKIFFFTKKKNLFLSFSYPKVPKHLKIFFNVLYVYLMHYVVNILKLNYNIVYKLYLVLNQNKNLIYDFFMLYFKQITAYN